MKTYDLVGIGFGPSNLALAALLEEKRFNTKLRAVFFEKKKTFSWHPEMLMGNANMQISFLKDIATLRNPSSPYTFLNYLHKIGRLEFFANLASFYPSRIEFSDYFSWVAKQLENYVEYSTEVIDIIPHGKAPHNMLELTIKNPEGYTTVLAKNIVVATGSIPSIPSNLNLDDDKSRIWHSSKNLEHLEKYKKTPLNSYRFCVVGAGQSAAEIVLDLHQTFPNATIYNLQRGFGFKPADDSKFVNEIFTKSNMDLFYNAPESIKEQLLSKHRDTNYSVVDAELINQLYQIKYAESVTGRTRLYFNKFSQLDFVQYSPSYIQANVKDLLNESINKLKVDAIILATGYKKKRIPPMIVQLSNLFSKTSITDTNVTRGHQLITSPKLLAGIYLQGFNEDRHGLADGLLSLISIRAQEIFNALRVN